MKSLIVDTNVLVRDIRLRGASWQTILRASQELGFSIVVPAVAFDEAIEFFRREYRKQVHSYSKALRKLENSLGTELVRPIIPDIELATSNYRLYLESLFRRYRVKVVDYPSVSHREIVIRAGRRKAPMANSDKGYKDYLIWKTVVELALVADGKVNFLTFNRKDFLADGALNPDLKDDLVNAGIEESVAVFSSLEQLLQVEIEPRLARNNDLQRDLAEVRIDWFVPAKVAKADAENRIGDELPGDHFELFADSVQITDIGEPEDIKVERVVRINDQFVKVDLTYTLPVEVEGRYVVDDLDPRIAAEGYQSGQGYVDYEIELILDLKNAEITDDYDLEIDT